MKGDWGLWSRAEVSTSLVWCRRTLFKASSFISTSGQGKSYFSTLKWLGVEEVCEVVLRGRERHWPLRCCKVAHLQCLRWCLGHPQQERTHHRGIRARVALSQLTLLPFLPRPQPAASPLRFFNCFLLGRFSDASFLQQQRCWISR